MFVNKVLTCFYIIIERVFVWFNAFFCEKGVIVMFHHVTNEELDEIPACLCKVERFKEIIDELRINYHTQSHSKLRYENNMQKEIFLSRKELEKKVGKAILFFAYPYGKLYTIGLRSIFFTQKTDYKNAVGTIDTSLTCFSMLFRYYLPRKVIY